MVKTTRKNTPCWHLLRSHSKISSHSKTEIIVTQASFGSRMKNKSLIMVMSWSIKSYQALKQCMLTKNSMLLKWFSTQSRLYLLLMVEMLNILSKNFSSKMKTLRMVKSSANQPSKSLRILLVSLFSHLKKTCLEIWNGQKTSQL